MSDANLQSAQSSVVENSVVDFSLADEERNDISSVERGGKMERRLASGVTCVEVAGTPLRNEFNRRNCECGRLIRIGVSIAWRVSVHLAQRTARWSGVLARIGSAGFLAFFASSSFAISLRSVVMVAESPAGLDQSCTAARRVNANLFSAIRASGSCADSRSGLERAHQRVDAARERETHPPQRESSFCSVRTRRFRCSSYSYRQKSAARESVAR